MASCVRSERAGAVRTSRLAPGGTGAVDGGDRCVRHLRDVCGHCECCAWWQVAAVSPQAQGSHERLIVRRRGLGGARDAWSRQRSSIQIAAV